MGKGAFESKFIQIQNKSEHEFYNFKFLISSKYIQHIVFPPQREQK